MATAAEPPLPNENIEKLEKENIDDPSSKPQKEKKIGHRRVDADGLTTYKKTPASALSRAIQLGISHTVGGIIKKPERDVLLQDFVVVETTPFPSEGSSVTPAHHYADFRFKTYAPVAFRYFRDLFGILPEDFMLSISAEPLVELSNPGASGSLFFVTHDDEFIIKTVQHKEAEFLQKLLPGYYMNLVQNPRTLLPKFYGLYCIQAGGKNIRMVVMNNLLPRHLKMHMKFDLKGSTFKRKASKHERAKKSPTFKDLDILSEIPEGIMLDADIHAAFTKTMQRDCLVLRSFKIMDYSLLLGIHNLDKDKALDDNQDKRKSNTSESSGATSELERLRRPNSRRRDLTKRNMPDSIMSGTLLRDKYTNDLDLWSGGIPATSSKGDRLLLFCGLIDILQCYKLSKKLEHTFKSMVYDADSVSVHRPGFYCDRFQKFMSEHVFKKAPGQAPVKSQPGKRKAQTTRRATEGYISGGTSGPANPSPLARSKTSPAHSGKKLQSDRPDLLPSESPRPTYTDSQEEDSDSAMRYGVSRTPPRMQIRMEDRSPNNLNASSSRAVSYSNVPSQQVHKSATFSTRSKETEFSSRPDVDGPGISGTSQGTSEVKLDQVKLQWNDSPAITEETVTSSPSEPDLQRDVKTTNPAQTTSFATTRASESQDLEVVVKGGDGKSGVQEGTEDTAL